MNYYFYKNLVFSYSYDDRPDGLDWLTPEQESFLEHHPGAKAHEIRALLMDSDKSVDLNALKSAARRQVLYIANCQLIGNSQSNSPEQIIAARDTALNALSEASTPTEIDQILSTFGHE